MGAGYRPGQNSDGSPLKRGYSLSVESGVVASYPRAGSVPCGLPDAQIPILIEVCYSVMLPEGHSMLTDRYAFLHVAWFFPLFIVLMLPWSSALLRMVASTKPRGVGNQKALPLCNFLRSIVLPGSQVQKFISVVKCISVKIMGCCFLTQCSLICGYQIVDRHKTHCLCFDPVDGASMLLCTYQTAVLTDS
jgi:hypothetical protein